jgi:hypothetical protein
MKRYRPEAGSSTGQVPAVLPASTGPGRPVTLPPFFKQNLGCFLVVKTKILKKTPFFKKKDLDFDNKNFDMHFLK